MVSYAGFMRIWRYSHVPFSRYPLHAAESTVPQIIRQTTVFRYTPSRISARIDSVTLLSHGRSRRPAGHASPEASPCASVVDHRSMIVGSRYSTTSPLSTRKRSQEILKLFQLLHKARPGVSPHSSIHAGSPEPKPRFPLCPSPSPSAVLDIVGFSYAFKISPRPPHRRRVSLRHSSLKAYLPE